MSRFEQISAAAIQKGLYSPDVSDPTLVPFSVRRAIGNQFFDRDPSTVPKAEQKGYLMELRERVVNEGVKADWVQWLRLPHHDQDGKVVRKAHSENTMMQVFIKLYKQEQHILNERSFSEQQESQTALVVKDDVDGVDTSHLSEEGEVPPTPDQDLSGVVVRTELSPVPEVVVVPDSPPLSMRVDRSVQRHRVDTMLERIDNNTLHRSAVKSAPSPEEIIDFMTRQIQKHLNKRQ